MPKIIRIIVILPLLLTQGCRCSQVREYDVSPVLVAIAFLDSAKAGNIHDAQTLMHPDARGWEESFTSLSGELDRREYRISGERIHGEIAEVGFMLRKGTDGPVSRDDVVLKLHRGRWYVMGL